MAMTCKTLLVLRVLRGRIAFHLMDVGEQNKGLQILG